MASSTNWQGISVYVMNVEQFVLKDISRCVSVIEKAEKNKIEEADNSDVDGKWNAKHLFW